MQEGRDRSVGCWEHEGRQNCFVSGKSEISILWPAISNWERNPSFPEIKNPLPLPKSVSSDKGIFQQTGQQQGTRQLQNLAVELLLACQSDMVEEVLILDDNQ